MTWGVVIDVAAPVEVYDAVHAEVLRRTGAAIDGLLVHVCRPVDRGFQVIEVWESRTDFERYDAAVVQPVIEQLPGGPAGGAGGQGATEFTEFEVRGLVVPEGGVVR